MKNKNNKGFSLVELLIVVVIFSIVFASAASMMIFTSKSFVKARADANVQKEAQLVVNQIGDMIIDSTGDIDFVVNADSSELVIYGELSPSNYIKETVKWVKDENIVKYSKNEATYDAVNGIYTDGANLAADELLAEGVTNFNVDLSDVRKETDEKNRVRTIVESAKVSMEYKDKDDVVSYATTPVITLRNRMQMVGSAKEIEPVIQYELGVDVRISNVKTFTIGDKTKNLKIKCTGTIMQTGFDSGDLTYKWTVDKSDYVTINGDRNGNLNNPDHCYFTIKEDAIKEHVGDTVTFTLTATAPPEKHDPVSGSDAMKVGAIGGDERGIDFAPIVVDIPKMEPSEDVPDHWVTNGDNVTIAYDFVFHIYDESGNIAADEKYLIDNRMLYVQPYYEGGGKTFSRFHLVKSTNLVPTKSYTIVANMKVRHHWAPEDTPYYQEFSQTFVVPAVRILSMEPKCPWKGFNTKYGQEGNGDGLMYETEGFYGVNWVGLDPYTVECVGFEANKELPEGYSIDLSANNNFSSYIAVQEGLDIYRIEFKLAIKDIDGKELSQSEIDNHPKLKDLKLNYVDLKMTVDTNAILGSIEGRPDLDADPDPIVETIRVRFTDK